VREDVAVADGIGVAVIVSVSVMVKVAVLTEPQGTVGLPVDRQEENEAMTPAETNKAKIK
jgi:hypothetical protein